MCFAKDGDGSFSIANYKPRLKYENHIKELQLFYRIKEILNPSSNLIISNPRKNRPNSNITVNLDITDIHVLKNKIRPLFSLTAKHPSGPSGRGEHQVEDILRSKKIKDFKDWCIIIDIYYFGYHLLSEGKSLI